MVDGVGDDLLEWGSLSQISKDERQLKKFWGWKNTETTLQAIKRKTLLGQSPESRGSNRLYMNLYRFWF